MNRMEKIPGAAFVVIVFRVEKPVEWRGISIVKRPKGLNVIEAVDIQLRVLLILFKHFVLQRLQESSLVDPIFRPGDVIRSG